MRKRTILQLDNNLLADQSLKEGIEELRGEKNDCDVIVGILCKLHVIGYHKGREARWVTMLTDVRRRR